MQTINRYARSYFSGFCEIWHWKKNDCKTIAFALVKIASYATIIVPGTMFGLFLLSELMDRVSKKDHVSEQEQKISKVANDKLSAKKGKENVGNKSNHQQPVNKKKKKTKSPAVEPSNHEESESKKSCERGDKESQVKKSVQESSEHEEPEGKKLADDEQHVRSASSKKTKASDPAVKDAKQVTLATLIKNGKKRETPFSLIFQRSLRPIYLKSLKNLLFLNAMGRLRFLIILVMMRVGSLNTISLINIAYLSWI